MAKCIYLSGPVTGIDYEDVCRRFDAAEKICDRMFGPSAIIINPVNVVASNATHEDAMVLCLQELLAGCDMLVSLPGWEESEGARLERAVARAIGIELKDLDGFLGAIGEINGFKVNEVVCAALEACVERGMTVRESAEVGRRLVDAYENYVQRGYDADAVLNGGPGDTQDGSEWK